MIIDGTNQLRRKLGAAWRGPLLAFVVASAFMVASAFLAACGVVVHGQPAEPGAAAAAGESGESSSAAGGRYDDDAESALPAKRSLTRVAGEGSPASEDAGEGVDAANLPRAGREDLAQLVADLGSPSWPVREMAEFRLLRMDAPLSALDGLLREARDAEVLWRLERVYRALVPPREYYGRPHDVDGGFLGIGFEMVSSEDDERLGERHHAARVTMLVERGPAEIGGMLVGDMLLRIDGEAFVGDFQSQHLQRMLVSRGAGQQVRLEVLRDGRLTDITVTLMLGERGQFDYLVRERRWQRYWAWRRTIGAPAERKEAAAGAAGGDDPAANKDEVNAASPAGPGVALPVDEE